MGIVEAHGPGATDWATIPYDNIDRLLLVEARIRGMVAGVVPRLYAHVRADGPPLCLRAADAILSRPEAHVGVVTGVYWPPHFPSGEIDGPIGALVLSRGLSMLGYSCSIIMEAAVIEPARKVADEMRWNVEFMDSGSLVDRDSVVAASEGLDIVIASERVGVNRQGIRHSINGTPFEASPLFPWADELVDRVTANGGVSIGFGDGGNEIGFGQIYDYAQEIVPQGLDCGCECGGGIVTRTATQHLLPVNVSNLGVYGLLAALALATKRPEILHSSDAERRLLAAAVDAGMKDGGTGLYERAQDGIPESGAAGLVDMLAAIVENGLREYSRQF